jgi:WD40 repeat protein
MSVRVLCSNPACRHEYRIKPELLGKSGKCKACGSTFTARNADEAEPAAHEVSMSMLKDEPAPAPKAAVPSAAPPTAIGRFELKQKLGAGAFGAVYLAFDPQLQREVAIKVPQRAVLGSPQRVERFLREARSAAKLQHPNIVPVFDAGQAGKQYYIASAFVKGRPLSELIDDGGIELKKAATIVRSLGEALAYAHQQGVVHRDVKPANVMLGELGQPLLMDFGLAAQVDAAEDFQLPEQSNEPSEHDDSRLTRAGAVMGTPSYMAPEIAGGLKGEAKPAADQYALGVVLFELLTGRTPFEGPPAAVLHQVMNDPAPSPKQFRKDLPADLETICRRAMAKDPADRYVTCFALAEDLRRWLEGEPIRARRLGLMERARRWMKKEPKLALLSGGMAAAVAIIIGLLSVLWMQSLADGRAVANDRDQARLERDDSEARRKAEQDAAEKALADQRAREAAEKIAAGDHRAAAELLKTMAPERRGPAWPFLVAQAEGQPEFRRMLGSQPSLDIAFTPDNRFLLQVTNTAELLVWDVWTERAVSRASLARDRLALSAAAISADGKRIAAAYSLMGGPPPVPKPVLVVWDDSGKALRTIPLAESVTRLAMDREGKRVAGIMPIPIPKLAIWDAETGEPVAAMNKQLASVPFPIGPVAFSADGKRIATSTALEKGELRAWDVSTGEETFVMKERAGSITHLAFSPDGTRLAAAGGGELEGPEYTTERTVCEAQTMTYQVEVDGRPQSANRVICVTKTVKETCIGFRNPRLETAPVMKCVPIKKKKMEHMTKTVTKTVYVEAKVVTKKNVDGKDVDVEMIVKVPKTVFENVSVPVWVEYDVVVPERVNETRTVSDPGVRIWSLDGTGKRTIDDPEPITALEWRDDEFLATASNRGNHCGSEGCSPCKAPESDSADVKLWDAEGRLVQSLPSTAAFLWPIAFSPDRKHVAAGGSSLVLWSAESRSLMASFRADGPINELLFNGENTHLAGYSKCSDTTWLWDVPGRRLATKLPRQFQQFLPGPRLLALRSDFPFGLRKPLDRWNAATGKTEPHPGGRAPVWAWSADGRRFIAAPDSGKPAAVFDGQTGERVCELEGAFGIEFAPKIQFSRDGSRIAAHDQGSASLWNGSTGKLIARKGGSNIADLSADGKSWVVVIRGEVQPIGVVPTKKIEGPQPPVAPAPWTPPGTTLVMFDGDGKELRRLPSEADVYYESLAFDPTGKRIIGVTAGSELKVWNAAGTLLTRQSLRDSIIAVSPDGRFVACHPNRSMMMPPVPPKEMPKIVPKPLEKVTRPADLPIEFAMQVPPPAPVQAVPVPAVQPVPAYAAFPTHDSEPCCELRPCSVALLDLADGKFVWQTSVMESGHGEMAFSVDGKRLARGHHESKAGRVRLWDTAVDPASPGVAKIVASFGGHVGPVHSVAFSTDGKTLASGGEDRTVKVWNVPGEGEFGPGWQDRTMPVNPYMSSPGHVAPPLPSPPPPPPPMPKKA